MDETIGAKGGKNDRRRSLIIETNKKKKLIEETQEQELKELEKRVKKQQKYILIKALPIALTGGIIKTIYDTIVDKKEKDLEEENSKWKIKEYDADVTTKTPIEDQIENGKKKIVVTPEGRKVVVYVKEKSFDETNKDDKVLILDKNEKNNTDDKSSYVVIDNDSNIEPVVVSRNDIDEKKNVIDSGVKGVSNEIDIVADDFDQLSPDAQEKLEQIKAKKIVSEYETRLKDLRYELRNIIYDYSDLLEDENEIVFVSDAEYLIDKLSELIRKIEDLKNKIKVENIDQYDENYIYYLIQDYFDEFKNKKVVDEMKDSPLYIMIEEKLNDIDKKKDELEKRLDLKKEQLSDKENKYSEIKDKYYSIDKINQQLEEFQVNQEKLLRDIKEKIDNAKTVREKVYFELVYMDRQTNHLANIAALQMIFPGPRFVKGLVLAAAAHVNFMRNIMRPKVKTIRYKEVLVDDYSEEIKKSISSLDEAIDLLNKTSKDISNIIYELKEKYKDYSGVMNEYDSMLYNLYKIQSELEEKEYEMQKVKAEQEKQLERNDAKVLTRGTYPVN